MLIPKYDDFVVDSSVVAVPEEHSKNTAALVAAAKNMLKASEFLKCLENSLLPHLHVLYDRPQYDDEDFSIDMEPQEVIEKWIDELLKFLALKILKGDMVKPCQLAPSHAIFIGWKTLILLPTCYFKVCTAMGSSNVFDPDPLDDESYSNTHVHLNQQRSTRYNATLRAYHSCYGHQPPSLYWSFFYERPKKKTRTFFLDPVTMICGCSTENEPTDISILPAMYTESL